MALECSKILIRCKKNNPVFFSFFLYDYYVIFAGVALLPLNPNYYNHSDIQVRNLKESCRLLRFNYRAS